MPLLEVEDLRVEFPTRRGVLVAVDKISFSIGEGEVLGVVGESGAGKSLTGMSIIGLLGAAGADCRGLHPARPAGVSTISRRKRCGAFAASRSGAVFHGPADQPQPALHHRPPAHRDDRHPSRSGRAGGAGPGAGAAFRRSASRPPERRIDSYPHEFSGRHAPAGGDRARARRQSAPADRGRADNRARCVDPGADHRAAEAPVPRARARRSCWSRTIWA